MIWSKEGGRQQLLPWFALAVSAPLLALFVIVRVLLALVVFVRDVVDFSQHRKLGDVRSHGSSYRAKMRVFWVSWGLAILLLAATIWGAGLLVTETETWPSAELWIARVALMVLAALVLYAVYILAQRGTTALQQAMAHNVAVLIALELEKLKAEAQRQARLLSDEELPAEASASTSGLAIPKFLDEADNIRKLLGEPTEKALEQLLLSLEKFNRAIEETRVSRQRQDYAAYVEAHELLMRRLSTLSDRLRQVLSAIGPYCRLSH